MYFRTHQRYFILALITIVLAFSTGDRAILSVAGAGMSEEPGLTPVQMGWLFSSFAWACVLAHIPAGWLVDRLGAKRTVIGGLVRWSLCTMFKGSAGWFASAFASEALGVGLNGFVPWPLGISD